jgi:hypothetical protein
MSNEESAINILIGILYAVNLLWSCINYYSE